MVSSDFTEPPPPVPSTSRTSGMRSSWAICSAMTCLAKIDASAAPPRTVKSSPPTTTGRASMRPRPITKLAGRSSCNTPASYVALPASEPTSRKEPLSSNDAMRSRTVSLPPACCRSTFSGPPMASAIARRRASSSSSSSQPIAATLRRGRTYSAVAPSASLRSSLIASAKPSAIDHRSGTSSRSAIAPKSTLPMFDNTVMLRPAPSMIGPSG